MSAMFFLEEPRKWRVHRPLRNRLKSLADTCEFETLKESLIRDRIVFGIQDSTAREKLLRDAELTLKTATEKVRAAELTQVQLKKIKAGKRIDESIHAIKAEMSLSEKD